MKQSKTCRESLTIMTQLILPNDTNHLGDLMGGTLMRWMDMAGAMAAMRHTNTPVVTAAVDHVSFQKGIPLGSMVILEAFVTRTFRTSLEVFIEVHKENLHGEKIKCNEAFLTFVALDEESRKPVPAQEIIPESSREKELYAGALRRRELRLVMAGRMKPEEAGDLRKLFRN